MNFFLICYFLLIRGAIERYFRTRMQDNMNFVRNVSLFSGKECARQFLPASERAGAEATGTRQPDIFFGKSTFFKSAAPDTVKNLLFTATDHTGPEKY